jgi:hypothetical protein
MEIDYLPKVEKLEKRELKLGISGKIKRIINKPIELYSNAYVEHNILSDPWFKHTVVPNVVGAALLAAKTFYKATSTLPYADAGDVMLAAGIGGIGGGIVGAISSGIGYVASKGLYKIIPSNVKSRAEGIMNKIKNKNEHLYTIAKDIVHSSAAIPFYGLTVYTALYGFGTLLLGPPNIPPSLNDFIRSMLPAINIGIKSFLYGNALCGIYNLAKMVSDLRKKGKDRPQIEKSKILYK